MCLCVRHSAGDVWRVTVHFVQCETDTDTVLEVLNQQGGVLGFWAYRSGLGVVSMVPIDSPPSEGPGTTLVPWKTGRMVAGTMESMGTNGWQLGPPPLVPPN